MKNIILTFSIFLLFTCNNNQPNHLKTFSANEDSLYGVYRISSGGGYGVVLSIKDSINIDYLMWVDVGGYYFGRKGKYKSKQDTLFLRLFHPIDKNTHYVRIDTLLIEKWKDGRIFKPIFGDNWLVDTDDKTNKVISGRDCFAKVAELNENYYQLLEISRWDTLIVKNSISLTFPPTPQRPSIDSMNKDLDMDEIIYY